MRIFDSFLFRRNVVPKINKMFPTQKLKKEKEYKGELLMLKLEEGGDFRDLKIKHFTASAIMGDITDKGLPLTFYAKIVGFQDKRAPMRNWGMTIKGFVRKYLGRKGGGIWQK